MKTAVARALILSLGAISAHGARKPGDKPVASDLKALIGHDGRSAPLHFNLTWSARHQPSGG
jgi:hypothetical protein